AGRRLAAQLVALRLGAPEERVVERVEVRPLWDRSSLAVERPVRGTVVGLEPRRRLDGRAVSDRAVAPVVAGDLRRRRDVLGRLAYRARPGRDPQAGP